MEMAHVVTTQQFQDFLPLSKVLKKMSFIKILILLNTLMIHFGMIQINSCPPALNSHLILGLFKSWQWQKVTHWPVS